MRDLLRRLEGAEDIGCAVADVGDIIVGEPGEGVFHIDALGGGSSIAGGGTRRVRGLAGLVLLSSDLGK